MNDKELRRLVIDELEYEPSIDAADIGVAAKNGVVTLSGYVTDYAQKTAAERAAWRVKGVKGIAQKRPADYALRRDRGPSATPRRHRRIGDRASAPSLARIPASTPSAPTNQQPGQQAQPGADGYRRPGMLPNQTLPLVSQFAGVPGQLARTHGHVGPQRPCLSAEGLACPVPPRTGFADRGPQQRFRGFLDMFDAALQ